MEKQINNYVLIIKINLRLIQIESILEITIQNSVKCSPNVSTFLWKKNTWLMFFEFPIPEVPISFFTLLLFAKTVISLQKEKKDWHKYLNKKSNVVSAEIPNCLH